MKAEGNDDIELPLEPRVKMLRFRRNYLTTNKKHWINRGFASYFNLNSVVISKRGAI